MSSDLTDARLGLEHARALIELHRFDEASSLVGKVLSTEPDDATAWCLLSQARGGVGDSQGALDAAERASALAPEEDWPHRLRSVAMQQLGDDKGAVSAARAAVAVAPHNWQTHSRLAIALGVAKKDLSEALASAERGVELAPGQPAAHYALGVVNDRLRRHAEAERCFRQALELDPQHAPSHNALAARQLATSRFGRAGNLAGAAAGFRDAVQANPREVASARNLELVLRVFLSRLSYLVFLIVYLASRDTGSTLDDRIGPLVLLVIPAVFATRFLVRLAPDLRRQVFYIAFHGPLAAPMIAQVCAVALLFVGAAAPGGDRGGIGVAALVTSLAARLLLARRSGARLMSARTAWVFGVLIALGILFLVGTNVGGFDPSRGAVFVFAGLALGLALYAIRRRRV
jgi:Flp pilus assembly protein TadD